MNDASEHLLDPQALEARQLVAKTGWTQSKVAEEVNARTRKTYDNATVSKWTSGKLKIPAAALDALRNIVKGMEDVRNVTFPLTETAEVVPLFGYSNAAGATLRLNEEQRVGVAPMHPAQRGSKKAFAVRQFGDKLAPRIKNGDTVFAIYNMTPIEGEPCVIETDTGEALIEVFERMDTNTLFFSETNPKKASSIARQKVVGLHAVVGLSFAGAGPIS